MTTKFFIKNDVYNRKESVKDLLRQGADPNVQDKYGNTPLMIEVCSGRDQDVKYLLKNGADPNVQDDDGLTPLMIALCYNDIEKIKDLLKHGADIENLKTKDGRTTTTCATVNRNYEVAKMVICEAIARRKKKDSMNKLIDSIPYYVNKRTFMKCNNRLNMDVMRYISEF